MKKLLLFITLFISVFALNVSASQAPYRWHTAAGDNQLPNGATQTIEGKVVTLKLNNYNGEGLTLECLGTGQEGMQFVVELTGDNKITDSNIGLNVALSTSEKLVFKGDGSLLINAPKPISYESYQNTLTIIPSENIYTDKEVVKDTESDAKTVATPETTSKESDDEKTDYNMVNIIIATVFGLYVLISLIFIVLLVSRIPKNN